MKKIFIIILILLLPSKLFAQKQVIGTVTLAIGEVKTNDNRILSAGDPIYFNDTVIAGDNSKSQIILLENCHDDRSRN